MRDSHQQHRKLLNTTITIILLFSSFIHATQRATAFTSSTTAAFITRTARSHYPPITSHFTTAALGHSNFISSKLRQPQSSSLSFTTTKLNMSSTPAPTNPFKKLKLTESNTPPKSTRIIGTHSGSFQADEAMGVWLLRQLPTYYSSKVIRSRDPAVLDTCDIVIDVGGVYDHEKLRYDHHQRGYDERFEIPKEEGKERISKLSASGLVYRHYGREVISSFYPDLPSDQLELVYKKMYDTFMEPLDAIDTGVESLPADCGVELAYRERTGLSSRVGRLNPRWNEVDESTGSSPDPDERFEKASQICGDDFLSMLVHAVESDLPARAFVEKAIKERMNVDSSGEIITFKSGGLPWKGHLYDLEKEMGLAEDEEKQIKFVLYTDQAGMWRVQAVSVEGQGFTNRLGLPEEWRGVRDADLSKVAGIEGCTFCHVAGFIGGNKTFEGALEMAKVALRRKKK